MPPSADLQLATDLARAAGRLVLDHYGKVRRLTKRNEEAVTDADRAAQRLIVERLRARFPQDGVLGEESETGHALTFECPAPGGVNGRVWVIDPIDGTNNFVAGFGNFAVCIGLMRAGEPVMGVIYDVTRDALYAGVRGEGATLNGRPLRVAATPLGAHSVVCCSSNLVGRDGRAPQWAVRWLNQTTWKMRMLGSAAMEAMLVASGVAHGAVCVNGKLWDIAPAAAILKEAGAVLTDLKGQPVFPFDLARYDGAKVPYLIGTPQAHEELLREIKWHP
jgi:myo-inositol-1(or 4)-monophosphatase